jgi:hypothetical protein
MIPLVEVPKSIADYLESYEELFKRKCKSAGGNQSVYLACHYFNNTKH